MSVVPLRKQRGTDVSTADLKWSQEVTMNSVGCKAWFSLACHNLKANAAPPLSCPDADGSTISSLLLCGNGAVIRKGWGVGDVFVVER